MAHSEHFMVVTATRAELGDLAAAISEWRTARYLDAGFYHRATVESLRHAGLAVETNRSDDYEIFAITPAGRILATLSLRRPLGVEGRRISDADRPGYSL
ncbi:MAG: hypothetical protein OEM97_05260, partial [Acidimicrobiia bacterium]|nr:hypothetical protein [Acidimicrobiia bacterium]